METYTKATAQAETVWQICGGSRTSPHPAQRFNVPKALPHCPHNFCEGGHVLAWLSSWLDDVGMLGGLLLTASAVVTTGCLSGSGLPLPTLLVLAIDDSVACGAGPAGDPAMVPLAASGVVVLWVDGQGCWCCCALPCACCGSATFCPLSVGHGGVLWCADCAISASKNRRTLARCCSCEVCTSTGSGDSSSDKAAVACDAADTCSVGHRNANGGARYRGYILTRILSGTTSCICKQPSSSY